jgi:hypothetical protein
MPDSASIAALAVQVTALRGQVSLINKRLDAAGTGDGADLAARVDELARTVSEALDGAAPRGPAALRWDTMDEEARRARLAELAGWVRTVLMPWYPDCGLRDCWPQHVQAVIELGNLWTEWRHIYEQRRPPIGLALDFHDRWLPNTMRRIEQITRHCIGGCSARPKQAGSRPPGPRYQAGPRPGGYPA